VQPKFEHSGGLVINLIGAAALKIPPNEIETNLLNLTQFLLQIGQFQSMWLPMDAITGPFSNNSAD
jgi:hypothetical protein